MDPEQDPETLELFKAEMARNMFDESVTAWQRETDKALAEMVEEGLLVMRRSERGYEVLLTAYGKAQADGEV